MLDISKANNTDSNEALNSSSISTEPSSHSSASTLETRPKLFTLKKAATVTLNEPTLFKTTLITQVNNNNNNSNSNENSRLVFKPNEENSPSLVKKYATDSNNNSPKFTLAKHNSIGLMLLKTIENSMKDELENDVSDDSEKEKPTKIYEERKSPIASPSPSLTNFNTANKYNFSYIPPKTGIKSPKNEPFNRFNVLGYVKVEDDHKKHVVQESPVKSSVNKPAYHSPSNQFKIKRDDLKEISYKYENADKKSRGHVNKLNDPHVPSVTQSRTFKLLQETLDNGKYLHLRLKTEAVKLK